MSIACLPDLGVESEGLLHRDESIGARAQILPLVTAWTGIVKNGATRWATDFTSRSISMAELADGISDDDSQTMENEPSRQDVSGVFPPAVTVDVAVDEARRQRLRNLTRVTMVGIMVRLGVIAAEAVGAWISGSAALLVDVVASMFDVVASIVLIAAMRFAARPPDDDHPFGHGRVEPLAGFQLAVFLSATGLWFGVQNFLAISNPAKEHSLIPSWTWLLPATATVVLTVVTWAIYEAGRRARSSALQSESVHFLIDAVTSLLTAGTLLAAALVPDWSPFLDHSGGFLLSVVMICLGVVAARENLNQLLDRIPHEQDFVRVKESALKVEGVIDVEKVRIQQAGPDAHVNIDIEVDPQISVETSHGIAQLVRAQIQTDWPFVREVVVHVEPFYAGDH